MFKHLEEVPRPPVTINPDIPTWFSDLVLHLLEKKAGMRPKSAEEVVEKIIKHRPELRAHISPVAKQSSEFIRSHALTRKEPAHKAGYIPSTQTDDNDDLFSPFDCELPQGATLDADTSTHTPLIASTLNPANRVEDGLLRQGLDPTGVRERHEFIAEEGAKNFYRNQAVRLLGSIGLALVIGALLLGPLSSLVIYTRRLFTASNVFILVPATLILSVAIYSFSLALPFLTLKLVSSEPREAFLAWLKMTMRIAVLGLCLFGFYVSLLFVKAASIGAGLGRINFTSAMKGAMTNLVEVCSLSILGTFYKAASSYALPELLITSEPTVISVIPYYLGWMVFILFLVRFTEREILKMEVVDKRVHAFLLLLIAVICTGLYFLTDVLFIYLIGLVLGAPDSSTQVGPFVMPFTQYFVVLAIINWTIVLGVLVFLMPRVAENLRRRKGIAKK